MNLGPSIWGPHGWKFIHMIALAYPDNPTNDNKKNYKNFFTGIQYILPCSICRDNYKKHLKDFPLTNKILNSRELLIKWTIDIHNMVNKETGKPELKYEDALKIIINNYPKNINDIKNVNDIKNAKDVKINDYKNNKIFPLCALFLILISLITIAVIYKKY